MAPLTWRTVEAPNFSGSSSALAQANQAIQGGFQQIEGAFDQWEKNRRRSQLGAGMADLARAKTAADIDSFLSSNTALATTPELAEAAIQRGQQIRQNETADILDIGRRTQNEAGQYTLGQQRVEDGRKTVEYESGLEAGPIINQIQTLAANGQRDEANALAAKHANVLTRSGFKMENLAGNILRNVDSGFQTNANALENSGRMRNEDDRREGTRLYQELVQQRLTPEQRARKINDLTRTGNYSAGTIDIMNTLFKTASGEDADYNEAVKSAEANGTAVDTTFLAPPDNSWANRRGSGGEVQQRFMGALTSGDSSRGIPALTNRYAQAAVAATVKNESNWDAGNIGKSWDDPSESGASGTSGELMSWRGPRLDAVRRFTSERGNTPEEQALFFLQENPKVTQALQNAGSVEEAQQIMNRAWAFAGYDKSGNAEVSERLRDANQYYSELTGAPANIITTGDAAGMEVPSRAAPNSGSRPTDLMTRMNGIFGSSEPEADAPRVSPNSAGTTSGDERSTTPVDAAPGSRIAENVGADQKANEKAERVTRAAERSQEDIEETIPLPKAKDMLAEAATDDPSLTQVDPNRSEFIQRSQARTRASDIDNQVSEIAGTFQSDPISRTLGRAWDFVGATAREAAENETSREKSRVLGDWWRSGQASQYFQANPGKLAEARRDPEAFAERMVQENNRTTNAGNRVEKVTPTQKTPAQIKAEEIKKLNEPGKVIQARLDALSGDKFNDTFGPIREKLSKPEELNKGLDTVYEELNKSGYPGLEPTELKGAIAQVQRQYNVPYAIAGELVKAGYTSYQSGIDTPLGREDAAFIDFDKVQQVYDQWKGNNSASRIGLERQRNEAKTMLEAADTSLKNIEVKRKKLLSQFPNRKDEVNAAMQREKDLVEAGIKTSMPPELINAMKRDER